MKIIKITPNDNGSRPPLQDWGYTEIPSGFARCPDEFVSVFYSTTPSGFVNIEVEDDTVITLAVNEESLAKYIEEHPAIEPTESEPTTDEILNVLFGV